LPHFLCRKKYKEIQSEKLKRHSKGHTGCLYYSCKVESTWRTTQLLRHTSPKKSTPIIKFTEISLFCTKLGLTSWFLTNCLVNKLVSPIWTSSNLDKSLFVLLLVRLSIVKPLIDWTSSLTNRLLKWMVSTGSSFNKVSE
jgi:hypothetical protein